MELRTVKKIFQKHGLGEIRGFDQIEVGFTNEVYLVDEGFILKVCEDEDNEENFEKEVFLYDLFQDDIPVPKIEVFDDSKEIYEKVFMIYPKIEGENLYSRWHLLDDSERKEIIKQLCEILRKINRYGYDEFERKYGSENPYDWRDKIVSRIYDSLKEIEERRLLSQEFIQVIKEFVDENEHVLEEQRLGLVYWDPHFDNILVDNTEIVGILDFERTDISSIDFVLDIVKRMVDNPTKYMSERSVRFADEKDYERLMDWFEEYYPELFEFDELEKRLNLYSVEHDLDTLCYYPDSQKVRQMIADAVGYHKPLKF